jgi:formylglycine-generating enzyme required for sulfatase activity
MRAWIVPWVLAAAAGCRDPTAVTLDLSTDVACSEVQGTSISVGNEAEVEGRSPAAITADCTNGGTDADNPIGTLVVVPSDDDSDPFAIKVVLGIDVTAEECMAPQYQGCVVARRALRFVPHTPLLLPIPMRGACKDVPCTPNTTCVLGRCVDSTIDCTTPGGCGEDKLTSGAGGGGGQGGQGGDAGSGGAGTCMEGSTEDGLVGCVDHYLDADGDGHGALGDARCLCAPDETSGYTALVGDDCNDDCNVCWSGNPDVCDGIDNDCSGSADVEDAAQDLASCSDGVDNDCDDAVDYADAECCVHPPVVADCTLDGMCHIPAGCFTMGSPITQECRDTDEAEVQVALTHSFWISRTEVTQPEYLALMGTNPSVFDDCVGNCPVEKVSWHQAATYCNALSAAEGLTPCYVCAGSCTTDPSFAGSDLYECPGYRLPTEAEWEYAARAGDLLATPIGEITDPNCKTQPELDAYAWLQGNSLGETHDTCGLTPNAWGLCDMLGNIGEWVHEAYVANRPPGPLVDPPAPTGSIAFTKGGSWFDPVSTGRYADRYKGSAPQSFNTWGFRCIRSDL